MKLFFNDSKTNGFFTICKEEYSLRGEGILKGGNLSSIVCNIQDEQKVIIDQVAYAFPANSVLPLMSNQHFVFERPEELIAWQFNRDFYCIADHDAEVGCVGYLYYGIQNPLFIKLTPDEVVHFELLNQLCMQDMETKDRMQGEMLRTLLKRLIINITRIAKRQNENMETLNEERLDIVRMFNLLVEVNFKKEHEVQFYAKSLNKSPKTLSNVFAMFNYPAPSKLIQRRIFMEAKRYLKFTDKSAKEIAFTLGFTNPAHFSRFFKQQSGISISSFKGQKSESVMST